MSPFYGFSIRALDGSMFDLAQLKGRVVLIVNVASRCGFTPQYTGLETLWQQYRQRGLMILACPCNQFGAQEPGSAAQIAEFCRLDYPVSFTVLEKIEVNGPGAHPLYRWLKSQKRGFLGTRAIKWNFTKFLLDQEGRVVARFAPQTRPEALKTAIEALLN